MMPNNDLISRAAAIDAIVSVTVFPDADYIKNLCENPSNSEDWLGGVCEAINAVEEVNAVDAVPVEWLEDRIYDMKRAPLYRRYAEMLLMEWLQEQKEQEAQDVK